MTKRLLTGMSSEKRKEYPMVTGFMDYFPDAMAMVSHISYKGNQKHNPGEPLHWARGKSMDHEDCLARHTIERDEVEDDILHAANRAWRAMAALQEMLEAKYKLDLPRGATADVGGIKTTGVVVLPQAWKQAERAEQMDPVIYEADPLKYRP